MAQFVFNSSKSDAIGMSPFEAYTGITPCVYYEPEIDETEEDYHPEFKKQREKDVNAYFKAQDQYRHAKNEFYRQREQLKKAYQKKHQQKRDKARQDFTNNLRWIIQMNQYLD
jgi:hypothetical protein